MGLIATEKPKIAVVVDEVAERGEAREPRHGGPPSRPPQAEGEDGRDGEQCHKVGRPGLDESTRDRRGTSPGTNSPAPADTTASGTARAARNVAVERVREGTIGGGSASAVITDLPGRTGVLSASVIVGVAGAPGRCREAQSLRDVRRVTQVGLACIRVTFRPATARRPSLPSAR